jgi:hypothetical protein
MTALRGDSTLLVRRRVNLGDVAAGKLHDGRISLISDVRSDKNHDTDCFGFGQGAREVSDLISGHLSSIWIREVTIRHKCSHLAELGFDADSAISIGWATDFDTGRVSIVRYDSAMRERKEAADERAHTVGET